MARFAALAALFALLAASVAAAATTPTQYRSAVNAMCRSYTPKMKAQENAMTAAKKANDGQAYGVALGKLLVLQLGEDSKFESAAIPAALRPTITPIVATFKKVDVHLRAAIVAAANGDGKGMVAQLTAAATAGSSLNKKLDAAGLRDCGSNQT